MGVIHWVVAVVGIFALTVVFMPFMPAFDIIKTDMSALLPADDAGQQAMNTIEMAFYLTPFILIVGLILYAIAATERREYDSTRDQPDF